MINRLFEGHGDIGADINQRRRTINKIRMIQVRPNIPLFIQLTRPDVAGIRCPVQADQFILIGVFLLGHRFIVGVNGDVLLAQLMIHQTRLLVRILGIDRCLHRPVVNLIEIRLAGSHLGRRDVKGHRIRCQPEWIHVRLLAKR